jgi:hypothetical protein
VLTSAILIIYICCSKLRQQMFVFLRETFLRFCIFGVFQQTLRILLVWWIIGSEKVLVVLKIFIYISRVTDGHTVVRIVMFGCA